MGKFEQLRKKFDGSDPFISQGHQIIKSAGATRHATRLSKVPEWARDDGKVQALLLRSFPKLKEDPRQRTRAARWALVINLYYRMGCTQNHIAEEMKISPQVVNQLLVRINRVATGTSSSHPARRSNRPRGRPKKLRSNTDP